MHSFVKDTTAHILQLIPVHELYLWLNTFHFLQLSFSNWFLQPQTHPARKVWETQLSPCFLKWLLLQRGKKPSQLWVGSSQGQILETWYLGTQRWGRAGGFGRVNNPEGRQPSEVREANDSGREVVVWEQGDWSPCRNKPHIHCSQQLSVVCFARSNAVMEVSWSA